MWYKRDARYAAPGPSASQRRASILFVALCIVALLVLAAGPAQEPPTPDPAPVTETPPEIKLTVLPAEIPILEGGTVEISLSLDRYSTDGVTVGYIVYSRDYDTADGGLDYEAVDVFESLTFHKTARIEIHTLADSLAEGMESFHFEIVAVSPGVLLGDLPTRQSRIWIEDLPRALPTPTPTPDPDATPTPTPDPDAPATPTPEPEPEPDAPPTPTLWPTSPPFPTAPTPPPAVAEPPPPSRMDQLMPWLFGVMAVGGIGYLAYRKGWLDRWIRKPADETEEEESEE